MRILKILFALSFTLLAACSTRPRTPTTSGFNIQGLAGITMNGTQNSANFNWYEYDGSFHIEFYGPLGMGSTYLDGDDQSVALTLSDQQTYNANSPEILMQNVLGWSLPVTGLRYWLLAKPVPNEAVISTKDNNGHIVYLSQEGWNITYSWRAQQSFPHKVVLVRPNVKVVIVINKIY